MSDRLRLLSVGDPTQQECNLSLAARSLVCGAQSTCSVAGRIAGS